MHEDVLALDVFKRDVRSVRQTLASIRRTIQPRVRNAVQNLIFKQITQCFDSFMATVFVGQLTSSSQTYYVWHRRRSGTTSVFLRTPNDKWRQRNSLSHVEGADPLRRVQFVTG